jgi:hypothetical protein
MVRQADDYLSGLELIERSRISANIGNNRKIQQMAGFEKGHQLSQGRPKGSKNRINKDIRQVFHQVYEQMGENMINKLTGKPMTGLEAMLDWARNNPTEFYRLYGKMIPAKPEEQEDTHEDFIADLVLEDEIKLVEATDITKAVDVGDEGRKQLPSGASTPSFRPDNAPHPRNEADLV